MKGRLRLVRDGRPVWWDAANDRAMLICRISDKKQKDGVSLEAQEHHGREYAARVGLNLVLVRPFQESAKCSKMRAEFHAAIAEAQSQGIKHLIFHIWDRISRNFTDSEMLEELILDDELTLHVGSTGTVLHSGSDGSEFFLFDITIAQATTALLLEQADPR
jgi:DNA invertase Pin-like site-specific DNA recombinase